MTRQAVLVCPGRGTYNKPELGYLVRHHAGHPWLAEFDAQRAARGEETVTALDGATRYSVATYSRGDVASPLIYAAALLDSRALAEDIEIVAVTGNSMGWYIALAAAGALSPTDGFTLVDTMGGLMQSHLIGGQTGSGPVRAGRGSRDRGRLPSMDRSRKAYQPSRGDHEPARGRELFSQSTTILSNTSLRASSGIDARVR